MIVGISSGGLDLKSIHLAQYRRLLELLIGARKQAGITQQQLAVQLNRPQSFVSKIERGERRIDVVEFLQISRLIGVDPHTVLKDIEHVSTKCRRR